MAKYKMSVDFVVDIDEDCGVALTIEDISNALRRVGYKTELVKNISNEMYPALFVFGNKHKIKFDQSLLNEENN